MRKETIINIGLALTVKNLVIENPNDADLGELVRLLVRETNEKIEKVNKTK